MLKTIILANNPYINTIRLIESLPDFEKNRRIHYCQSIDCLGM